MIEAANGEVQVARGDAIDGAYRRALAMILQDGFRDRNYVTPYVARRCRVSEETVKSWLSAGGIPADGEWGILLRMDRSLHTASDIRIKAMAEPPGAARAAQWPPLELAAVEPEQSTASDPTESEPAVDRKIEEARATPMSESSKLEQPTKAKPAPDTQARGSGLLEFRCKITHGQIISMLLPPHITEADVLKIAAFLRTQIDD